jgi:ATP-dependent RNA helicase SUPV3L1/SUV3
VIFASLDKFDGEALRPLLPAEVQQIAGRAGRYRSEYGEGLVTCLDAKDLGALREG